MGLVSELRPLMLPNKFFHVATSIYFCVFINSQRLMHNLKTTAVRHSLKWPKVRECSANLLSGGHLAWLRGIAGAWADVRPFLEAAAEEIFLCFRHCPARESTCRRHI
jgi:hypothetical protein